MITPKFAFDSMRRTVWRERPINHKDKWKDNRTEIQLIPEGFRLMESYELIPGTHFYLMFDDEPHPVECEVVQVNLGGLSSKDKKRTAYVKYVDRTIRESRLSIGYHIDNADFDDRFLMLDSKPVEGEVIPLLQMEEGLGQV